jgi:hypothetical protein
MVLRLRGPAGLDAFDRRRQPGQGAIVWVDRAGRVRSVVWLDQRTHTEECACAPLVFLCASTLGSTRALLLSRWSQSASGLGGGSGVLGRYLMDHVMVRARGQGPHRGLLTRRGAASTFRFDARELGAPRSGRGFGVQLYQGPAGTTRSYFSATSFGEMLPRPENRSIPSCGTPGRSGAAHRPRIQRRGAYSGA